MSSSNTIATNGNSYRFNTESNTYQQPLVRWKGRTFSQIFASLQKNKNTMSLIPPSSLRHPLPQKLYRKEFATTPLSSSSSRTAVKIDGLNAPNGYSISSVLDATLGEPSVVEDYPFATSQCGVADADAKKRVRSAGMYPKKFAPTRNNDSIYHSSTKEYLVSRSKTFEQNQYQYYRGGANSTDKPGQTASSFGNDNSAQGIQHWFYDGDISTTSIANLPHKNVIYKPNNWKFATRGAVDSSLRTDTVGHSCVDGCQR
jgi:hypothetical protein